MRESQGLSARLLARPWASREGRDEEAFAEETLEQRGAGAEQPGRRPLGSRGAWA